MKVFVLFVYIDQAVGVFSTLELAKAWRLANYEDSDNWSVDEIVLDTDELVKLHGPWDDE